MVFASKGYDRLAALLDGRVAPEGIDLNIIALPVEETFYRQARYAEFDLSEMSLSTYVLSLADPSPEFVALPVFPSRYFRHQSIFVNRDSGIRRPEDLAGRTVGVPEYQITATVWQRGMLSDDYGVRPADIVWRQGGIEQPGRPEKVGLSLPPDVRLEGIGPDDTLGRQLARGEIDALMCAHVPSVFAEHEHIVRLFPDYKTVEQEYFRRTALFPIMHVVVVRRRILEEHPWVARSLYKAFEEARAIAMEELRYRSSLTVMLPWLADHLDETVRVMGDDYWPYGLEKNRRDLDTFLRYSSEQGLSARRLEPEELFAPSTLTAYAI
jgi:4,5-dihydroxyphthalate decarboxylase